MGLGFVYFIPGPGSTGPIIGGSGFGSSSGSGSTMISALKNNRKFIGCELDREYAEKSIVRAQELLKVYKET